MPVKKWQSSKWKQKFIQNKHVCDAEMKEKAREVADYDTMNDQRAQTDSGTSEAYYEIFIWKVIKPQSGKTPLSSHGACGATLRWTLSNVHTAFDFASLIPADTRIDLLPAKIQKNQRMTYLHLPKTSYRKSLWISPTRRKHTLRNIFLRY